jgi:hypothetical protein
MTWGSIKRLTWNSGNSYFPAIAVDATNAVYVVWYDWTPGLPEIYFKKSSNGGATWTTKRVTNNSGWSISPRIAVDSNYRIHVILQDNSPGNYELFYKRSTNGGSTWQTRRLTWNSATSEYPTIAVDSNNHIHVAWQEKTPVIPEIYYKKSTNGGATWITKRLTWNVGNSDNAAIGVDSNNHIHLVWTDTTPSNHEIYHKRSTNGGVNWVTKRLTWNTGISWVPAIATPPNNNIHIVWQDNIPGNYEIYYKKGIQ